MKAVLVLEDGSVWPGEGFGAFAKVSGEVVFNTGMVGYPESITDPSYHGQILCQTYPLIGNYGVSSKSFESDKPKIWGYIVSELCEVPSHASSEKTLDAWLKENAIPVIAGLDTRALKGNSTHPAASPRRLDAITTVSIPSRFRPLFV